MPDDLALLAALKALESARDSYPKSKRIGLVLTPAQITAVLNLADSVRYALA